MGRERLNELKYLDFLFLFRKGPKIFQLVYHFFRRNFRLMITWSSNLNFFHFFILFLICGFFFFHIFLSYGILNVWDSIITNNCFIIRDFSLMEHELRMRLTVWILNEGILLLIDGQLNWLMEIITLNLRLLRNCEILVILIELLLFLFFYELILSTFILIIFLFSIISLPSLYSLKLLIFIH